MHKIQRTGVQHQSRGFFTAMTVNARLEGQESVEDIAGYLANWFDIVAIRTPCFAKLATFAAAAAIPVMNLRTHRNHPCEILGDLAYIRQQRGSWDGLHVAVVAPYANILRSWIEAAAVLPISITQVAPTELLVETDHVTASDDPRSVQDADVIITDCWPGTADAALKQKLARYRIDGERLSLCRPEAMFIPCPPVTRGEEVAAEAMSDPRCQATQAKAFLLHVQNAVLEMMFASR
ncbi:aspartate/ornithine carbamoyltransferase Asp/Orn-binding region (plasmid) [Pantoea sp. At-9b]|nr:aspartate/ornithine carbamoyltransferase Asp/Orn-binding region [Pantoea sp. At-9b]